MRRLPSVGYGWCTILLLGCGVGWGSPTPECDVQTAANVVSRGADDHDTAHGVTELRVVVPPAAARDPRHHRHHRHHHSREDNDNSNVLVTSFAALTPAEADGVIAAAEAAAAAHGGWETARHTHARTTDLSVWEHPSVLAALGGRQRIDALARLAGQLYHCHGLPTASATPQPTSPPVARADGRPPATAMTAPSLEFYDLFVAKYQAEHLRNCSASPAGGERGRGGGDNGTACERGGVDDAVAGARTQKGLELHQDNSAITLQLALSEPGVEFAAGGTAFRALGCRFSAPKGGGMLFAGGLWHAGVPITAGLRYMVIGFSKAVAIAGAQSPPNEIVDAITPAAFGLPYSVATGLPQGPPPGFTVPAAGSTDRLWTAGGASSPQHAASTGGPPPPPSTSCPDRRAVAVFRAVLLRHGCPTVATLDPAGGRFGCADSEFLVRYKTKYSPPGSGAADRAGQVGLVWLEHVHRNTSTDWAAVGRTLPPDHDPVHAHDHARGSDDVILPEGTSVATVEFEIPRNVYDDYRTILLLLPPGQRFTSYRIK